MNRYKIRMSPTWRDRNDGNVYSYGIKDITGETVDRKFFEDPTNRVIFVRGGKELLRKPVVEETRYWKFFNQFSWNSTVRSDNMSVKPTGDLLGCVTIECRERIEATKTQTKLVNGRYESKTHRYKTMVNRYRLNTRGQMIYDRMRKEEKPDLTEAQRKLDHEIQLAEFEATKFFGAYHNWCVERDLSKLDGKF